MTASGRLATESVARTRAVLGIGAAPLVDVAPNKDSLLWLRGSSGLAGWGEAARFETSGPDRFTEAVDWWREYSARLRIEDEVGVPGCGPVAFGSFTFDDTGGKSVLVVPSVVEGRRSGVNWRTTIGAPEDVESVARAPIPAAEWVEDPEAKRRWERAVTEAVHLIRGSELSKVVLARQLRGELAAPLDPRTVADRLTARFPSCWTFAVDGLFGATPELLVARSGREVRSLALAGTAWRTREDTGESLLRRLAGSVKNTEEHAYAAKSVADVLDALCDELEVPDGPELLQLPNVVHLATRITGSLSSDVNSLAVAGMLHPTAAVCGTPTLPARRLLRRLEDLDRDRYAGPVGWMDARGDGEWCLALRCASVTNETSLRLYAGCGIVADSVADNEWEESEVKLGPVRDLFGATA